MKFIGVSSSDQARRGYWRVVLAGDILDLGYFFSNPLTTWPERVEQWRASIDAGAAQVPAVTSTASSTDGKNILGGRAVVDVFVLGADQGDSVGAVARRMSDLTTSVDVESVQLVQNADPIARDAALQDATASADPLGINHLVSGVSTAVTVIAVIAALYLVVRLLRK